MRRFYGVRLSDVWAGIEDPVEFADLVAHVPRGGAMAEWLGGWGAVTAEEEGLRRIEYVLVAVNSKKRQKPPKPPEGVREGIRKKAKRDDQMRRWRKKHG